MSRTWKDLGPIETLKEPPLREIQVGDLQLALCYRDEKFSLLGGVCPHAGGPLGKGSLDSNGNIICPWHYFSFDCQSGIHRFSKDFEIGVPVYETKIEAGHLWFDLDPIQKGKPLPESHSGLNRPIQREEGPIRIAGISTTMMTKTHPRYSTSEDLLQTALSHAADELGAETRILRLHEMNVRPCEGFYSKSSHACIWPCTITRADREDQMREIYENMIYWADVLLVATPIRWGAASALYYKMVERMNCVQNQITLNNRVLIQNKVAAFIITGGQDNVQLVAGQMLGFFAELGFLFPPFPFIAHSLGWDAENMERNVDYVQRSGSLHQGAKDLVGRAAEMSAAILGKPVCAASIDRAGRKASGSGSAPEKKD